METVRFKLWLLDEAVTSLIEAVRGGIDIIDAMEFSTDKEFTKILGVPFKWTRFIVSITMNVARSFVGGAQFEDIITDTISRLLQALSKPGSLRNSVETAKANSSTPEELLNNMKAVVSQAARFRVGHQRDAQVRQRSKATQFSQMDQEGGEGGGMVSTVSAGGEKPHDRMDSASLSNLVTREIQKMHDEAMANRLTRKAARLEVALAIAPDRIAGMSMDELMAKHGIKQTQLQSVLEDIQEALGRVAGRLGDETLLHGVERFKRKAN